MSDSGRTRVLGRGLDSLLGRAVVVGEPKVHAAYGTILMSCSCEQHTPLLLVGATAIADCDFCGRHWAPSLRVIKDEGSGEDLVQYGVRQVPKPTPPGRA